MSAMIPPLRSLSAFPACGSALAADPCRQIQCGSLTRRRQRNHIAPFAVLNSLLLCRRSSQAQPSVLCLRLDQAAFGSSMQINRFATPIPTASKRVTPASLIAKVGNRKLQGKNPCKIRPDTVCAFPNQNGDAIPHHETNPPGHQIRTNNGAPSKLRLGAKGRTPP